MHISRYSRSFVFISVGLPLLLYLIFFIYPALRGLYVSFFDWDGFSTNMRFIELGNFTELATDRHFWAVVMRNTFSLLFVGGALVLGLAMLFSHLLTQQIWGRRFLRAAIFFPNIVNPVALAILWAFVYNQDFGLLNALLDGTGLSALKAVWTSPDNLFWALLVALVWIYTGFFTVIFVAALDRIPSHYIEAATLEGANPMRIFFSIKLPLIRDILAIALVLWMIEAMKQFSFLYAWGGGGNFPQEGQQNLAVFMYAMSFGSRDAIYRMGYASAMGVLMLLLVGLVVILFWRLSSQRKLEY